MQTPLSSTFSDAMPFHVESDVPLGIRPNGRGTASIRIDAGAAAAAADSPKIFARAAVITRTKNRPILLRRAMASVAGQTFRDFVWVVVNDGGGRDPVETIVEEARKAGVRAVVLHHTHSRGMEAASNAAIHAVDSEFLVIHDDADSWQPEFLERTIAFLGENPGYAGVVTHTTRVDEVIEGDAVRTIAKYPYNAWLTSLYLIDMLGRNSFAPIAFLYRREAFDAVGDYDESLPVLGDWDFNIRFLQRFDIGVLPEKLANYHHRVRAAGSAEYGNTVIAGIDTHLRYDTLIRNRLLRRDLEAGRFGPGCLASLMRWQQIVTDQQGVSLSLMRTAKRFLKRIPGFAYLFHRLRG